MPDCKVGMIISSSKSMKQLIQRAGRLLRPSGDRVARLYVLCAVKSEWDVVSKLRAIALK